MNQSVRVVNGTTENQNFLLSFPQNEVRKTTFFHSVAYDVLTIFRSLKDQCVGFRGIYWQKWKIIFIFLFSVVYDHVQVCFCITLEWAFYIYGCPLQQNPPCGTTMFLH